MFWSIWYLFVAPTRAAVINGLEKSNKDGRGHRRGGGCSGGQGKESEGKERKSKTTSHAKRS